MLAGPVGVGGRHRDRRTRRDRAAPAAGRPDRADRGLGGGGRSGRFIPIRGRGRALAGAASALAAGATCLSDIEAMTAPGEIFGSRAAHRTARCYGVLNELADRLNTDELPGRRLARVTAAARVKAWSGIVARHGQLPAVKVAVST